MITTGGGFSSHFVYGYIRTSHGSSKITPPFINVNCFCSFRAFMASLFNSTFLVPALVLVFLITLTTLADCTCAVFSMKSISLHLNSHNSELLNPVLMANWNKFFHCSYLAAASRAETSLGDKGSII